MFETIVFDLRFIVVFVMGCISLAFALTFYMGSRALRKHAKKLNVSVFDKAFNIIDVYPEHRRIFRNVSILLLIELVIPFLLSYWMFQYIVLVLISGVILFLCLGLMMLESAVEILAYTNKFRRALKGGADLGRGDVIGYFFLQDTMPKLYMYYTFLAAMFFAAFAATPLIAPVVTYAVSQLVDVIIRLTISVSPLLIIMPVGLLVFAIGIMLVQGVGGWIKTKVFSFPPSIPFTAVEEQFERGVRFFEFGEHPYHEMAHRPLLEEPETEERKRRGLLEKKRLS